MVGAVVDFVVGGGFVVVDFVVVDSVSVVGGDVAAFLCCFC